MMKMWRRLTVLSMTLIIAAALIPLQAFAAAEKVEVKLTAGSPNVTINGEKLKVEAPYIQSGTTMVPLSVITKAFGAKLQLEKNKVITLTYNETKVVLTIGSETVTVNGEPSTLTAAPKLVNGVTMVPLRVIVQAFGATIVRDPGSKAITIQGVRAGKPAQTGKTVDDSDAGLTRVGDHYFEWTMNYPVGLALVHQSDNGDFAVWEDAAGGAHVSVSVSELKSELTKREIRADMEAGLEEGEILLERKSITVGDAAFEKMVTQTRDKRFYEVRAIQQNSRLYYVVVGLKGESKSVLSRYQALLDSFVTTFDRADESVKDLSKVKNGMIVAQDRDFGLSVQLPVSWQRDETAANPYFVSELAGLDFEVSSLADGDSQGAWVERSRTMLENSFAQGYIRGLHESTVQLPDGRASVLHVEYSFDQADWIAQKYVFLVKDAHKYLFVYTYNMNDQAAAARLFNTIIRSADIDTDYIADNFELEDELEDDPDKRVTKTSRKYGYSIAIPAAWDGAVNNFEESVVEYMTLGMSFYLNVIPGASRHELAQGLKQYFTMDEEGKALGLHLTGEKSEIFGGAPATVLSFVSPDPSTGIPFTLTTYMIEWNGTVYVIDVYMNDANATAYSKRLIEETVASLTFN